MTTRDEPQGAWIFVSHSHRDLDKVRRIRNALEEKGHNPLLFFLKCLDDTSELDDLIRREIEARTWFILCDSPNAQASRWVRDEIALIKTLEGKVYEVIDLDDDLDTQIRRIAALSRRATVFISYARADWEVANALYDALRAQDFGAFLDRDLALDEPADAQITAKIDEAVERGFYLPLLSPDALRSEWVRRETVYALQAGGGLTSPVIPVIVGDTEATLDALSRLPGLKEGLWERNFYVLSGVEERLSEEIANLIKHLKSRPPGRA